jgi:hypothetical protein
MTHFGAALSAEDSPMLAVVSVCKVVWEVEILVRSSYGDVVSILVLIPIGALRLFGFEPTGIIGLNTPFEASLDS